MVFFTELRGNFPQVLKAVKYFNDQTIAGFCHTEKRKEKLPERRDEIERDLHRAPFVNLDNKKFRKDFDIAWRTPSTELFYAQGNMFAGTFITMLQFYLLHTFPDDLALIGPENLRSLNFAYFDDHHKLCGFGISFSERHPELWVAAVFRNATAAPHARTITLFCNNDILDVGADFIKAQEALQADTTHQPYKITGAPDITPLDGPSAYAALLAELDCSSIQTLLSNPPIVDSSGLVNSPAITDLLTRIKPGHDIDDYPKLSMLIDALLEKDSRDQQTILRLTQILHRGLTDAPFLKKVSISELTAFCNHPEQSPLVQKFPPLETMDLSTFESLQTNLQSYREKQNAINQKANESYDKNKDTKLHQSIPRRQTSKLALCALGVSLAVASALTLTGIFAPLGLALFASIALLSVWQINRDECNLQRYQEKISLVETTRQKKLSKARQEGSLIADIFRSCEKIAYTQTEPSIPSSPQPQTPQTTLLEAHGLLKTERTRELEESIEAEDTPKCKKH